MVIKSVPVDAQDVIVFAIRGSARFMDWAVNMNQTPASPSGFLVGTSHWISLPSANKFHRTTLATSAMQVFSTSLAI